MSITKLSVVNVDSMLKEKLSDAKKLINNITVTANPKSSEALLMDETIIIIIIRK